MPHNNIVYGHSILYRIGEKYRGFEHHGGRGFVMTGMIICLVSFISGLGVWLFGTRPYVTHHGIVNTGATYYLSAWADWQQCRELARAKNDARALALARYFTVTQLAFGAGVILAICRI
jgi:hypothetical protein